MSQALCLVLTDVVVPTPTVYAPSRSWLEIRFDLFSQFDATTPEKYDAWISELYHLYPNVIVTLRGDCSNNELTEARYLCYKHWLELGVPFLDIDYSEPFRDLLLSPNNNTRFILSHHIYDYNGELISLQSVIEKTLTLHPYLCKLAILCKDSQQALELLSLYKSYSSLLIFAMGRSGGFTRIAAPFLGAPYTYCSYSGKELAPGMPSAKLARKLLALWEDEKAQ
jgi:3-dehydroquinate dehydratase